MKEYDLKRDLSFAELRHLDPANDNSIDDMPGPTGTAAILLVVIAVVFGLLWALFNAENWLLGWMGS
jgi:hypothetical protein